LEEMNRAQQAGYAENILGLMPYYQEAYAEPEVAEAPRAPTMKAWGGRMWQWDGAGWVDIGEAGVEKAPDYPTSYEEWSLAGGKAGTGKTYAKWLETKEGAPSEAEQLKEAKAGMKTQLMAARGGDGYVSPDDYKKGKKAWFEAGYSKDKYDEYFEMFANPTHLGDYKIAR
ncbi:MAG TPA: hypothetical protein VMW39_07705, partial [bacterium]|nr:hypothetical protein [bacterium]